MSRRSPVARTIDALNERVGRGIFWLLLLMVLVGTFNTLARYAGRFLGVDLSSNAFLELQWYLFSVLFLLGGAYTLKHDAHVRVDVVYDRLGWKGRAWINVLGHILFLLPFCVMMVWVSVRPVLASWGQWEGSPDPDGLPRYVIKSFIPLAFVLLGLQGIAELIRQISAIREGRPLDGPPEEDHI